MKQVALVFTMNRSKQGLFNNSVQRKGRVDGTTKLDKTGQEMGGWPSKFHAFFTVFFMLFISNFETKAK